MLLRIELHLSLHQEFRAEPQRVEYSLESPMDLDPSREEESRPPNWVEISK